MPKTKGKSVIEKMGKRMRKLGRMGWGWGNLLFLCLFCCADRFLMIITVMVVVVDVVDMWCDLLEMWA